MQLSGLNSNSSFVFFGKHKDEIDSNVLFKLDLSSLNKVSITSKYMCRLSREIYPQICLSTKTKPLMMSFAETINYYKGITSVSVFSFKNDFTGEQFSQINNIFKNIRHLYISYCRNITKFEFLTNLTKLTILDLSSTPIDNLSCLKGLTNLRVLNLSLCEKIPTNGLKSLNPLTKLKALYFKNSLYITRKELLKLKLVNLKTLNLSGCQNIRGKCEGYLKRFTQLQHLDLSVVCIEEGDFGGLKKLTALKTLNLSMNLGLANNDLVNLKSLKSLKTLSLNATYVTSEGVQHLKDMTHLETLNLNRSLGVGPNELGQIKDLFSHAIEINYSPMG